MTELKLQCDCGQKYKFDVEPVNGQMPFRVTCPICGVDGTAKANVLLQSQAPPAFVAAALAAAPPTPPPVPVSAGLRINTAPPPAPAAAAPAAQAGQRYPAAGMPRNPMAARPPQPKAAANSNLLLGVVGALVGAAIGGGLMFGFAAMTGIRFPLLGTGVGALTGLGARILYRGTDTALGAISGGLAAVATVGSLYLIYGEFPILNIISVLVSISVAYRVAS